MLRLQCERLGASRTGRGRWLAARTRASGIEGVLVDPRDCPRSCGVGSRARRWPGRCIRLLAQRARAATEKKARKAELVARQTLVSDLSRDVNTMISQLRPAPWIQSATIDLSSYRPEDNVSFESLQADGGGIVTCIEIATTGSWPLLRACRAPGLLGQQATEMAEDPGVDGVGVAVDPVRGRRVVWFSQAVAPLRDDVVAESEIRDGSAQLNGLPKDAVAVH